MRESPDEVRARLTREAQDRFAQRMQNATSVSAGDAAMHDLNYAIRRIKALTEAQLMQKAADAEKAREAAVEHRMHQALKAAWKYVNAPFTSNSARNEVQKFAEADVVTGQRIPMLFALQTAWTFVHGAEDKVLMAEIGQLLGHGAAWRALGVDAGSPAQPT